MKSIIILILTATLFTSCSKKQEYKVLTLKFYPTKPVVNYNPNYYLTLRDGTTSKYQISTYTTHIDGKSAHYLTFKFSHTSNYNTIACLVGDSSECFHFKATLITLQDIDTLTSL